MYYALGLYVKPIMYYGFTSSVLGIRVSHQMYYVLGASL